MNLSSMEYFVALARERSFTKAAAQLHITQQSLSGHIAALERELGCQLVVRRVPLELTYAGTVFLRYASDFQNGVRTLRQEFDDIANQQRGVLRIGVAFTRGHAIMPKLIPAFQREYPNICVELAEAANEELYQDLLNGKIDLAIANFPDALPGVELRDFYKEEVVLLAGCELLERVYGPQLNQMLDTFDRGDLSGLGQCPFLKGNPGDISSRIGGAVTRKFGLRPEISAKSYNMETLLSLCTLGVGLCFCPEDLARACLSPDQMAQLRIIRLGEEAKYPIRFGHLEQSYQWNVRAQFMRVAEQTFCPD